MRHIAKALVIACQHIDQRSVGDDDNDVSILESISAELLKTSEDERLLLIRVANELGLTDWPEEMGILDVAVSGNTFSSSNQR